MGAHRAAWVAAMVAENAAITRKHLAHGLLDAEITLLPSADNARRVFCTHSRFMSEPVTASPTRCQGCGLTLEVRDHFSRRLGAYMGVRIDAEVPGEVPREEVFDS